MTNSKIKQHGGARPNSGRKTGKYPYKKELPFHAYLTPEGAWIIKHIKARDMSSLKTNSQILNYAIKKAFY